MRRDQALAEFLLSAFDRAEFQHLLGRLSEGQTLHNELPGGTTSMAAYFYEAAGLLVRHGIVEAELFDVLRAARPARAAEIDRLAGLYREGASEQVERTAAPSSSRSGDPAVRRELRDFLSATFDKAGLNEFVAELSAGEELRSWLPVEGSPAERASALISLLVRHGRVDEAFFSGLMRAAPQRAPEVSELRRRWAGSSVPAPTVAPDPELLSFVVQKQWQPDTDQRFPVVWLRPDNWDDFGYKTTFAASLFLKPDRHVDLGFVRVVAAGQKSPSLPERFTELAPDHCSVGHKSFYRRLWDVPELAPRVLEALRDAAWLPDVERQFATDNGFKSSLLRNRPRGLEPIRAFFEQTRRPTPPGGVTPAWVLLPTLQQGKPKYEAGLAWWPVWPPDRELRVGDPVGLWDERFAIIGDPLPVVGRLASALVDLWDPEAALQVDEAARASLTGRFAVQIAFVTEGGDRTSLIARLRELLGGTLTLLENFGVLLRLDSGELAELLSAAVAGKIAGDTPRGGATSESTDVEPPRTAPAAEPLPEPVAAQPPHGADLPPPAASDDPPPSPAPSSQPTLRLILTPDQRILHLDGREVWADPTPVDWANARFGVQGSETLQTVQAALPGRLDRAEVELLGDQLAALAFGAPVPDEVVHAFAQSVPYRLVFDLQGATRAFPWEYLRIGGRLVLESRASLIRHVPAQRPARPLALDGPPKRLLFTSAQPTNRGELAFDEASHLSRILRGFGNRPALTLPAATLGALKRELNPRTALPPDGFHFLGHGAKNALLLKPEVGVDDGRLDADHLANLLNQDSLQFAFLGACHSGAAPADGEGGFLGVGEAIARIAGLPTVAMQVAVLQDDSTDFGAGFYEELERHGWNLELAVLAARQFAWANRSAAGIPVLYADVDAATAAPVALPAELPAPVLRFPLLVGHAEIRAKLAELPAEVARDAMVVLNDLPPRLPMFSSPIDVARDVLQRAGKDQAASDVAARVAHIPLPRGDVAPLVRDDPPLAFSWADAARIIRGVQESLAIPTNVILAVLGELKAGRHVILTGPVGTGKTTLARLIIEHMNFQAYQVTAAADWTTFDVIGGFAPHAVRDGQSSRLAFGWRRGALLDAMLPNWDQGEDGTWRRLPLRSTWLLIDEFNRADMDRALGALFTALETRELRIPVVSDDPMAAASMVIPIPRDFRIVATLNVVDRHYLFRMSDALKRRFAFVEVPPADDWTAEWDRLGPATVDPESRALLIDLRRFVYLLRRMEPVGSALLKAGRRFVEETVGAQLPAEPRLTQAIVGSLLPQLESLEPARLKVLVAWARGDADALTDGLLALTPRGDDPPLPEIVGDRALPEPQRLLPSGPPLRALEATLMGILREREFP